MVANFFDDEQPESSKVMVQREINKYFIDVLGIARTNLIKIQTPKIKFQIQIRSVVSSSEILKEFCIENLVLNCLAVLDTFFVSLHFTKNTRTDKIYKSRITFPTFGKK